MNITEANARNGDAMDVDYGKTPDVPLAVKEGDTFEVYTQTDLGNKKEKRLGGFRFGFGSKKKKSMATDDNSVSASTEKANLKKSKKEKKRLSKKASSSTLSSADSVTSADASTETSLPTADLSATVVKRPKLKSSFAGTLVRKISFGTLNAKKPVIEKRSQSSVGISPTISSDELDSYASAVTGYGQGLDGDDATSLYSSGEYVTLSTPPYTLSPSPLETDEEGLIYLNAEVTPELLDSVATSTPQQQPLVKPSAHTAKSYLLVPDEVIQLDTTPSWNTTDQSDRSSLCCDLPPSQLGVAVTLASTVHETPLQKPMERQQVPSARGERRDATATTLTSRNIIIKSTIEEESLSDAAVAKSTTFARESEKPVAAVMSDSGGAIVQRDVDVAIAQTSPLPAASHIVGDSARETTTTTTTTTTTAAAATATATTTATTTTTTTTSSIASETYRLRTAWITAHDMNTTGRVDDDRETEVSVVPPKPADSKSPSMKEQILSITTPVMEKQKMDAESKAVEAEGLSDDATSVMTLDGSVAGSSKSEVYFTPRDSPSLSPQREFDVDIDSLSPESLFSTPRAEGTSEESYSPPKEREKVKEKEGSGEDVMAQARARLSQNLGITSSLATQIGDKREHLYKILVIGELGTGKTSIIKRYVHQFFSQHYRATIGVDFALKVLNWDANTIIRLQLWDIAGQERFGNMTRVYYKEAVGAFIVFDVARAATFDAVVKWKQDLDSKVQLPDGSPIPCVLLANKCDQQKEGLVNHPAKMDEYCKEKGFAGWFETSAKENINIEEAARFLVTKILQNDQLRTQTDSSRDGDKFNLEGAPSQSDRTKSKCSC